MVEDFEENSHNFLINTFNPLIAEQCPQGDFELFGCLLVKVWFNAKRVFDAILFQCY